MTVLIRCDGQNCKGRYYTNATTRCKCPYCGHSTRVREAVIIVDPKIGAGWGDDTIGVWVKRETKQEFRREDYVEYQDEGVNDVIL